MQGLWHLDGKAMHERPLPVDLEQLLLEARWVRSLALHLARDSDGADELIQDTWMRALDQPPRKGGAPQAWLAQVMRNLIRGKARSESRRKRREDLVAAQSLEPQSTSASLERAQLQDRLVREVQRLDPETRALIVLRYYENRSSRVIAQELGVSDVVVRKRLQRGLQRLRDRLRSEYERDWRSACMALATSGSSLEVVSTPTGWGISLLMTMQAKVSLVAIVSICAFAFIGTDLFHGTNSGVPEGATENAQAVAASQPPTLRSAPEAGRKWLDGSNSLHTGAQATPVLGWTGRVLDPKGVPLANAEIRASSSSDAVKTLSTQSDTEGFFTLALDSEERLESWKNGWLYALHKGYAPAKVYGLRPQSPPTEVELQLADGISFDVVALDEETGTPLPDLSIRFSHADTGADENRLTDGSGVARFQVAEPGLHRVDVPPGETYPIHGQQVMVTRTDKNELVLLLRKFPRRLEFVVKDSATGRLIRNAQFAGGWNPPDSRKGVRVDWIPYPGRNGHVVIHLERDQTPFTLKVSAAGYRSRCYFVTSPEQKAWKIFLEREEHTVVQVLHGGEPLGAQARLRWSYACPILCVPPVKGLQRGLFRYNSPYSIESGEVETDLQGQGRLPLPSKPHSGESLIFDLEIQGPNGIRRDFKGLKLSKMPPISTL